MHALVGLGLTTMIWQFPSGALYAVVLIVILVRVLFVQCQLPLSSPSFADVAAGLLGALWKSLHPLGLYNGAILEVPRRTNDEGEKRELIKKDVSFLI